MGHRFSQTRPPRVAKHCGQVNTDCFLFSPRRKRRPRRGSSGLLSYLGLPAGFVAGLLPRLNSLRCLFLKNFTPVPSSGATGPRQRELRHNNGGQVRFTSTPFMTGFPLRFNRHGSSGLLFTTNPPASPKRLAMAGRGHGDRILS